MTDNKGRLFKLLGEITNQLAFLGHEFEVQNVQKIKNSKKHKIEFIFDNKAFVTYFDRENSLDLDETIMFTILDVLPNLEFYGHFNFRTGLATKAKIAFDYINNHLHDSKVQYLDENDKLVEILDSENFGLLDQLVYFQNVYFVKRAEHMVKTLFSVAERSNGNETITVNMKNEYEPNGFLMDLPLFCERELLNGVDGKSRIEITKTNHRKDLSMIYEYELYNYYNLDEIIQFAQDFKTEDFNDYAVEVDYDEQPIFEEEEEPTLFKSKIELVAEYEDILTAQDCEEIEDYVSLSLELEQRVAYKAFNINDFKTIKKLEELF